MKKIVGSIVLSSLLLFSCETEVRQSDEKIMLEQTDSQEGNIAIVIHGGAGAIKKEYMSDSLELAYNHILDSAISLGYQMLADNYSSVDVVTRVITIMENSPLFNAGKGAVFTHDEENELDASIMMGSTKQAGAVAGVKTVKNPILLAQQIMENSPHVMMAGRGAEAFAQKMGLELVSSDYFRVESRLRSLKRVKEQEIEQASLETSSLDEAIQNKKFGTVGCVALDKNGDIVAGTSTGGMTNKRWGRIGDSPIIGAGTYADNATCGVSSTGWGEFFIRGVIAYDIAAMMGYAGMSLKESANKVIQEKLPEMGGDGGIIALDRYGNVTMEFNTDGMYRAAVNGQGEKTIAIYKD